MLDALAAWWPLIFLAPVAFNFSVGCCCGTPISCGGCASPTETMTLEASGLTGLFTVFNGTFVLTYSATLSSASYCFYCYELPAGDKFACGGTVWGWVLAVYDSGTSTTVNASYAVSNCGSSLTPGSHWVATIASSECHTLSGANISTHTSPFCGIDGAGTVLVTSGG